MPVPRDIGWGILGPGFIAGQFVEDLARTAGARLVAVASRDGERARAFADQHGAFRSYADYAALAGDPDVDIVYVATPHSHHFEHARLMLEGGKAVLLEKPFTMTATEAEQLIDLARSRGRFLMDAMWTLVNPLTRDLVRRVRAGEIGAPTAFSATIGPIGVPLGHRVGDPALGGSFMLECLVYPMSLLVALAPELAEATAVSAASITNDLGADTSASVTLRSSAGIATMGGGFAFGSDGAGRSTFHLLGERGWLQVDDNLFNPGRATFSAGGAPAAVLEEPASAERYRWEIEEADRCLLAGEIESPLVPHNLTLAVMRLLDRGREAAALGAPR